MYLLHKKREYQYGKAIANRLHHIGRLDSSNMAKIHIFQSLENVFKPRKAKMKDEMKKRGLKTIPIDMISIPVVIKVVVTKVTVDFKVRAMIAGGERIAIIQGEGDLLAIEAVTKAMASNIQSTTVVQHSITI